MDEIFEKEIGLLSKAEFEKLEKSKVVILGLGGVGGYTFEGLLRAGIKNFILVDKDSFETTNINRQLAANNHTIGKNKVSVYKERAIDINKNVNIQEIELSITPDNIASILKDKNVDCVADCIDDTLAKIAVIRYCIDNNINIISSMGTANHIESKNLKIDKLSKTKYCPLAKKLRTELKSLNNKYDIDVLFFDEEPIDISKNTTNKTSTISYIPAIAGLKIAEFIIYNLTKKS